MKILFIVKMEILGLIKCSYEVPQSCGVLRVECSTYFEHIVQSQVSLVPVLRSRCNLGVQIIVVFDLHMSTSWDV